MECGNYVNECATNYSDVSRTLYTKSHYWVLHKDPHQGDSTAQQ